MTEPHTAAHTGLVVQQYRADDNSQKWVFRCWGTDTCDGWLSLGHATEQSASRALVRHVEEFHPPVVAQAEVKIQITGGLTSAQRREVERIIEDRVQRAAVV